MKNLCNLIAGILTLVSTGAAGQFQTGQAFIGGGFNTNFSNYKSGETRESSNIYQHDIQVMLGKFVKDNKATGWAITQSLSIQKFDNMNIDPKPLKSIGFAGERFWEFYKPLTSKFALYLRPSVGLNYTLLNTYEGESGAVFSETRTNKWMLGASVGAGIAWRLAPKWALYGGFALSNPVNVSAAFSKTESLSSQNPGGMIYRASDRVIDYQFAPGISSGGVSLGFRYFY